ncbi:MAG: hypothetical protein V4618_11435 [Pseudomonadota bacterium]
MARSGRVLRHPSAPRKRLYINAFGILVHAEPDAGVDVPFRTPDDPRLHDGWELL